MPGAFSLSLFLFSILVTTAIHTASQPLTVFPVYFMGNPLYYDSIYHPHASLFTHSICIH